MTTTKKGGGYGV